MVDTRKLRSYIKLSDLEATDVVEFVEEGAIVERDMSKEQDGSNVKSVLEMKVSLNGEEPKPITINQTTINILKKVWGADSVKWVGKQAKVSVVQTLAFGELKDVNVLQPIAEVPINPSTEQPAPPEPEPPTKSDPVEENFCQCGEKAVKGDTPNEQNQDVCTVCSKPMIAWDSDE